MKALKWYNTIQFQIYNTNENYTIQRKLQHEEKLYIQCKWKFTIKVINVTIETRNFTMQIKNYTIQMWKYTEKNIKCEWKNKKHSTFDMSQGNLIVSLSFNL